MRKLPRMSALAFGGVLAVCAFAVPMARAASWATVGTNHVLASTNLAFTSTIGPNPVGSSCADTEFGATVANAAVLFINSAAFRNCMGTLATTNCTTTMTANAASLPWTATAVLTTNIQIHNVDVSVTFENTPGVVGVCPFLGVTSRLTGTLTGGVWHPSATGSVRRITFEHDDNLVMHSNVTPTVTAPAFMTGSFRDTTATLNVFD